jgi:hypothetical protein
MKHWIVKVGTNSQGEQYAHLESDVTPIAGDSMGSGRTKILEVDNGPHDTPEDAWREWHRKRGNLKS